MCGPRWRLSCVCAHGLSGQLCSAAHPSLQRKSPPLHNLQNISHNYHHHSLCFKPFLQAKLSVLIKAPASAGWLEGSQRRAECYLSPLFSLSPPRRIHLAVHTAQNRGRGGCSYWNSRRTYRRKIRINPSEFPVGLSLGWIADDFLLWVSVFPRHTQRIAVGNPSLPTPELLSPPCVWMMTMVSTSVKFTATTAVSG